MHCEGVDIHREGQRNSRKDLTSDRRTQALRMVERDKGGRDPHLWGSGMGMGQEWTTSQPSPRALPTCAYRCCCTSSAMPTTTCWASTLPSTSPCARGAAVAMGSVVPQGCVPASQAGGVLTAAYKSAQPTVVAMALAPR